MSGDFYPSYCLRNMGGQVSGNPLEMGKNHRSRASEAYFSHPVPSQISCTLPSTFCICTSFLGHTVRFWRIGKERLGDQSLTKGRERKVGWWRLLACTALCTVGTPVTSANWLYQAQRMLRTTVPPMLGSVTAGKVLQRQLVRTLSASEYAAIEQTTPPLF